jgi:DNA-binding FrmR family transcriptional regulator
MQPEIQAEAVWRLNTAAGHLHAIHELVEAGRSFEEVVHQLKGVKAALRVVESRLIDNQVKHSEEIILNGSVEAQTEELAHLHKLYELLVQQPDRESDVNDCNDASRNCTGKTLRQRSIVKGSSC